MTAAVPPDFAFIQRAEKLIHALQPGVEFVNADIYARMKNAGWPDMTEPRQFGPMLLRLRREGVIEKAGVLATTARSHGGVASVWRRTQAVKEAS
jgi:hypothetical protein